ncbi:MAG: DNA/RNA nuclease SfsA [Pseudomonadota bacterium]
MELPKPLAPGRLVRRYKRFLADVALDESGEVVTAHCPNPGAMMGVAPEGAPVWLSRHDHPSRKLKYTWRLVDVDGGLVGIDTSAPNKIAEEAIAGGRVAELQGYAELKREVKYGKNSRIDILLSDPERAPCYVEVKNVHLMRSLGLAEFPDCVTARGAKHLEELGDMAEAGARAVMLFVVQRADCRRFSLAGDIDPKYAEAFARAVKRGVEAICYDCALSEDAIVLRRALPIDVKEGAA